MTAQIFFDNFFVNCRSKTFIPLTADEHKLAETVYPIVYGEISKHMVPQEPIRNDDEDYEDLEEKIEVVFENLKRIIELFDEMDQARLEFMDEYPLWRTARAFSIDELKKLAGSMNSATTKCNIAKIISSGAGIVGGAVIIASFAFPPAAVPLVITAGISVGVSGTTVFSTTAYEMFLLKWKTKKGKKTLTAEADRFSGLQKWFINSLQFVASVNALLSWTILKKLLDILKIRGRNVFERNNSCFFDFLSEVSLSQEVASLGCDIASIVVTFFTVTATLRQKDYRIFHCIILTRMLFFELLLDLDVGVEGRRLIAMLLKGNGNISTNLARLIFHGIFTGIGMALKALTVVFPVRDIAKESMSVKNWEHAGLISKAADRMNQELDVLEKIYKALKKRNSSVNRLSIVKSSVGSDKKLHMGKTIFYNDIEAVLSDSQNPTLSSSQSSGTSLIKTTSYQRLDSGSSQTSLFSPESQHLKSLERTNSIFYVNAYGSTFYVDPYSSLIAQAEESPVNSKSSSLLNSKSVFYIAAESESVNRGKELRDTPESANSCNHDLTSESECTETAVKIPFSDNSDIKSINHSPISKLESESVQYSDSKSKNKFAFAKLTSMSVQRTKSAKLVNSKSSFYI